MQIKGVKDDDKERISDIMNAHGFSELKDTQVQAFENNIMEDGNHLLVAETGNGKTLCAEAITKKHVDKGNSVAYLVPSTQLVRDKKRSIEQWIDDDIEVATGSGKYHHGDVVVATFNSFYQAILRGVGQVRSFDMAILDDFHELYGSFIGPGLEKSIAASKQHDIEIFAMSATIGNPDEIADWLDADVTVSNQSRSIPIREHIVEPDYSSKKRSLVSFMSKNKEKGPFLVFNYAKSWAESRAESIADKDIFKGPDINAELKLSELVDGTLPDSLVSLSNMIENGVAYHHSSLPRSIREWIEDLYQNERIECICATTTIAYGFDAPVQSVVVADMKRRGQWVGKWEYQQWIGRSARPGYGYDEGHAYVFTNDPRTAEEEFFEPRSLEPIQTHIDSPQQFRKLILELITMGWVTPDELEEFIQNTLYWNQLSTNGAWGRSFGQKEQRLENKLRETADWLEYRNFIRENRTSREFESTEKGESAVEFVFSTSITPTLSQVHTFHSWLRQEDNLEKLRLLGKMCDVFDLGLREDSSSQQIENAIKEAGLPINGSTVTASVLHNEWILNQDVEQIEKNTGINATYLTSVAYRISDTLKSTEELIEISSQIVPKWFDTYHYRTQRGIRLDAVPFVRNVRGIGRSRVRALRAYLQSSSNITSEVESDDAMWVAVSKVIEKCEDDDEFIDAITDNVDGIGTSIAARLVDFYNKNEIANIFTKSVEQKDGKTTLGDF